MFGRRKAKYADDGEVQQEGEQQEARHLMFPAESTGLLDWTIAASLALVVFAGLSIFKFPGLSPDVWNDAAVAAGLRPPAQIVSGLWRVVASGLYLGGCAQGTQLLVLAGRILGGLTIGCTYLLLRSMLTLMTRTSLREAEGRFLMQRLVCGAGALFFLCADPVWRAGQAFSPSGLLVFLGLLATVLFLRFMLDGSLLKIYLAVFILGVLVAETPLGLLLLLVLGLILRRLLRRGNFFSELPLLDPIVGQSARWMLTVTWALALVGMIGLNCGSFVWMKGLEASGKTVADLALTYVHTWMGLAQHAASLVGWILGFVICVLPMIVSSSMLKRGLNEDRILPYKVGAVFFFAGVFGYSQISEMSPLWFWTWTGMGEVHSSLLLQVFLFVAVLEVVFALAILGCDACCRNHVRLAHARFGQFSSRSRETEQSYAGRRSGWVVFILILVLLAGGVLPGRILRVPRTMLALIDDYVKEVLVETGDAKWVFTDGASDGAFAARYELAAAEQGRTLVAVSLMAGNSPYDQYLRLRHVTDAEDRMAFEIGGSTALWAWVRDKPARLKESATQLGFEMWKKLGRELPLCSGVLARPENMSADECAAGVQRANALAERILAFYKAEGKLPRTAGSRLRELFNFVQWRIARLARMRAERADRAGDVTSAQTDVKRSDELDEKNAELRQIMDNLGKARATSLRQVSPREGMQLALVRADFALARRYAEPILKQNAQDASANFAMAMSYYTQKQWNRAELYFKACLLAQPKEAAAWNNLAITYVNLKRFKAARTCIARALALMPDSAEIKDTRKEIEEAIKKNGGKLESEETQLPPAPKPSSAPSAPAASK